MKSDGYDNRTTSLTGIETLRRWFSVVREDVHHLFFFQINKNRKNIYIKLISDFEEVLLKETLRHTSGNISEAAKILGIHRNTVHRKIEELNIHIKERDETNN